MRLFTLRYPLTSVKWAHAELEKGNGKRIFSIFFQGDIKSTSRRLWDATYLHLTYILFPYWSVHVSLAYPNPWEQMSRLGPWRWTCDSWQKGKTQETTKQTNTLCILTNAVIYRTLLNFVEVSKKSQVMNITYYHKSYYEFILRCFCWPFH